MVFLQSTGFRFAFAFTLLLLESSHVLNVLIVGTQNCELM